MTFTNEKNYKVTETMKETKKFLTPREADYEFRTEEIQDRGGVSQVISLLVDEPCCDSIEQKITTKQLIDVLHNLREQIAQALDIAVCSDCGEIHRIEDMQIDPEDGQYICQSCIENNGYHTCMKCGKLCSGFMCEECDKTHGFCTECGEVFTKTENLSLLENIYYFDSKHRSFNTYERDPICPSCLTKLIQEENITILKEIKCRVYIFDENEEIKIASQENSLKLMLKHRTKNGTPIHFLYSSLISKEENEEYLRDFVKYAPLEAILKIISIDKEIIIKLIGQDSFQKIFKGYEYFI